MRANAPRYECTWLSERRRPHGQRLRLPSHPPNDALSLHSARIDDERMARQLLLYGAHYGSASTSMRRAFSLQTPMPLRLCRALAKLRALDAPLWLVWIPSSALRDTR